MPILNFTYMVLLHFWHAIVASALIPIIVLGVCAIITQTMRINKDLCEFERWLEDKDNKRPDFKKEADKIKK